VSLDVLEKCLAKKEKQLRKSLAKKSVEQFVFYFQGAQTLNIVVNHYPDREIPFVVQTAYYMPAISVKGRFKMNQYEFENWFKSLPKI
jgi:hypothetical protein